MKTPRSSASLLLSVAASFTLCTTAATQSVTRGPYLQSGTHTGVTVRWRTDSATDSRVWYGTQLGNLTATADDKVLTKEHVVTLSGLNADTTYYYAVGTTSKILAGNNKDHFVLTSPTPGTSKATRVWVIGDPGTGNSDARAVRDAFYAFTGSRHTDLWIALGDNAYSSGTDGEYQSKFFDIYDDLMRKSVIWSTLGNHDGRSADSSKQSGVYYNIFTLPKNGEAGGVASGTEAYYSFEYANIHFVCLDSYDSSRSPTGSMMKWLEQDVAMNTREWLIAFWHHPPYSKGSHDSDDETRLIEMRKYALPILEAAGVDLVLAGHSHGYERSFLIDQHYGSSKTFSSNNLVDGGDGRDDGDGAYKKANEKNAGAVYIVAGSSGKVSSGSYDHPAMYVSMKRLGSLVLDVNGSRLDIRFLDDNGQFRDYLTVLKSSSGGGGGGGGGGNGGGGSEGGGGSSGGLAFDPLAAAFVLVLGALAAAARRRRRWFARAGEKR